MELADPTSHSTARSVGTRAGDTAPIPLAGLPRFPGGEFSVPESRQRRLYIHVVSLVALAVTLGYLIWRTFFTLDLDVWWVSVPLLLVEFHLFLSFALFVHALWDIQSTPSAGVVTQAPGKIAILIPTFNESMEVLLPVIAAAQNLEPVHETWVLDDGKRLEVRELAASLGVHYLTRPDNSFAKAGNINHALEHVDAEFIAILDADHVPTQNFLRHTLGYFEDPRIALVQTPQDFYNLDSFEHEDIEATDAPLSDRERQQYHEQAMFYRVIQPGKNRVDGAFWCGTGAVVRVSALRDVGGIATETITEDIHTTIRLHRRGWKTVCHNEVLARGLAATNAEQFKLQRYRWGTGAMQVLRLENPLFVSGLTLGQRLAYATTLLGWFDAWRTLFFILIPALVLFTGAVPIQADFGEFLAVFGVSFLLQRWALRVLGRGYYREKMQLVFEVVRMTPNLLATLTLLRPSGHPFQVTPKGRTDDQRRRIRPPQLLFGLTALSVAAGAWYLLTMRSLVGSSYDVPWAAHGAAFWLCFNGVIVVLAIRRVLLTRYGAERRASVRFTTQLAGYINEQRCRIDDLSLTGARVTVRGAPSIGDSGQLCVDLNGREIKLEVRVRMAHPVPQLLHTSYGVEFEPGQIRERRKLALAIFNAQTDVPEWPAVEVESAAA